MKITREDYNRYNVGDIVIVQVESVDLNKYSIRNKPDAILKSEDNVIAVIPSNEYSMYHNFVTKANDAPGLIFRVEVIDKFEDDGKYVLKMSLRNALRKKLEPQLNELKEADWVPAKIVGFNDFGAYLRYKGLSLIMTNASFVNGNRSITISDILDIDDVVDVKFQKIKKRGREIRVEPLIKLPEPVWRRELSLADIRKGREFCGIIHSVTPNLIYVDIGRNADGSRISGSSFHPVDQTLDSLLQEGVEVMVRVDGVANNGYVYMTIFDVVTNSIYDYKMDYYMEVEKYHA